MLLNPFLGRAGFAIISITSHHADTGPTQQGCPVSSRLSYEVVIRVTLRRAFSANHYDFANVISLPCFRIKGCLSSGIAFQASCQQQGSAKKTNNEQFGFAYPLTSGRICSTITIGVPTLISFVACSVACSVYCLACLFINLRRKPGKNGSCARAWAEQRDTAQNLIETAFCEIFA